MSQNIKKSQILFLIFCSRCRTIIVIKIYLCQVFRCRLNTLQLSLLVASLDFVTQQKSPPLNRSANNCGIVFSSFIPLFFFVVSFIYWLKCHSKWYVGPFIPSMFCGAGKSLKTDLSLKPFANTTHLSFSCEIVKYLTIVKVCWFLSLESDSSSITKVATETSFSRRFTDEVICPP